MQAMPQPTAKQHAIDIVALLVYAAYALFFFTILLQGTHVFYDISDFFAYLLLSAIYGFGCMFIMDLCQSWIYLPMGVLNGFLALTMIYRMKALAAYGMPALFVNAFLFLVPMAIFAIMAIHLHQRKIHAAAH